MLEHAILLYKYVSNIPDALSIFSNSRDAQARDSFSWMNRDSFMPGIVL